MPLEAAKIMSVILYTFSVNSLQIAHVRYIKILTLHGGFRDKIAIFSGLHCPAIPRRDLDTKKTKPNIQK